MGKRKERKTPRERTSSVSLCVYSFLSLFFLSPLSWLFSLSLLSLPLSCPYTLPSCFSLFFFQVAAFQRQLDKNQRATALGLRRFGWLKHKKQGKKFFVLLDKGRMSWFRGPKEHEERGHVLLDEMAVRRELGEKMPSFTVYAPQQAALTHTWSTENDDELSRWMAVLEKATEHASRKRSNIADEVRSSAVSKRERVEKSGWLVLKGKKKFFILKVNASTYKFGRGILIDAYLG
jgi:hypothetical protein